jgi:hypothetical protein
MCPQGWIVARDNVGQGENIPREKVGPGRGWGQGDDVGRGRRRSLGRKCVPKEIGLGRKVGGGGGNGVGEKTFLRKKVGGGKDVSQ